MPRYLEEADRLGHNGIGCEHLLLGILVGDGQPAAQVLNAHGVTLAAARRRTDEIVGDGWQDAVRWMYSPRANLVRALAAIEAERLEQLPHNDLHVLLAIITEGESVPMSLFAEFGVDLDAMRDDLLDALEVPADIRESYLRQRRAAERQGHGAQRPPTDLDGS